MDESRVSRRIQQRPRPYDLRRKVLLKNFLRDQMTMPTPSFISGSINSINSGVNENRTSETHAENNHNPNDRESSPFKDVSSVLMEKNKILTPKLEKKKNKRLSGSRMKKLLKAKQKKKEKKDKSDKHLKHTFRKLISVKVPADPSKTKPHSFLCRLLTKTKLKKKLIPSKTEKLSTSDASTSNQSVQTDLSLMSDVREERNFLLIEENRLLWESFAYLSNDLEYKSPKREVHTGNSLLFSFNARSEADLIPKVAATSRVLRSKSLKESRRVSGPCRRSRSLRHSNMIFSGPSPFSLPISRTDSCDFNSLYRPSGFSSLQRSAKERVSFSRPKAIQRHSSLQEKLNPRKVHLCRRTVSTRERGRSRIVPFHQLSNDAFY